jgi:predicted RNA polymerase sigma factor
VIYLIFNEGYAATAGDDLVRPQLCAEAQRLGRMLAGLMPDEPEVLGLLALMELQASRLARARAPTGAFVPLPEQDRARWDRLLIGRGLRRWRARGARRRGTLRAAGRARRVPRPGLHADETDWRRIAALYDRLASCCRRRWSSSIGRRAQHGVRARGGAGADRGDRGRSELAQLCPISGRAR